MRIFHPAARAASFELLPKVGGGLAARVSATRSDAIDLPSIPKVHRQFCRGDAFVKKTQAADFISRNSVLETTRCFILLAEIKRTNLIGHR